MNSIDSFPPPPSAPDPGHIGPQHPPTHGSPVHGHGPDGAPHVGPTPGADGGPSHAPGSGDAGYAPFTVPQGAQPRRSTDRFFDSIRRNGIVRTERRWIGGVAGGVARRFDLDPVFVRCVWAVLCFVAGLGIIVYGIAWAFLPEESDGRIHLQQMFVGDVHAGLAGAVGVTLVGLADGGTRWLSPGVWMFGMNSPWDTLFFLAMKIAVVCFIVWLLVWLVRHMHHRNISHDASGAPRGMFPPDSGAPTGFTGPQAPHTPPSVGTTGPLHPTDAAAPAAGHTPATSASFTAPRSPMPAHPSVPSDTTTGVKASGPAMPRPGTGPASSGGPAAPTSFPTQPVPHGRPLPGSQSSFPAPAPRPRRMRVPGPGASLSFAILGLMCFGIAAIVVAVMCHWLGLIGGSVMGIGLVTALLGAGVLICALRRRRGGWMTGVGWLMALIAIPAMSISFLPATTVNAPILSNLATITVTEDMLKEARAQGKSTLDIGPFAAGAIVLDLTDLDDGPYPVSRIALTLGTGSVQIFSKQSQSIAITSDISVGNIQGTVPGRWSDSGGKAVLMDNQAVNTYDMTGQPLPSTHIYRTDVWKQHSTLKSERATQSTPDLTIDATIGAGYISISESPTQASWSGYRFEDYWIIDRWTDADGVGHPGTELPLPGTSHPVVSASGAEMCLDMVNSRYSDTWEDKLDDAAEDAADSFDDWTDDPNTYSPGVEVWLDNLDGLASAPKEELRTCLNQALVYPTGTSPAPVPASGGTATPSPTPAS